MALFEIKNKFDGSVIFKLECGSLKLCVEAAVKSSADLSYADLHSADLRSADLRSANLCGAKYGEGVPIEHEPLQTLGTKYAILVMDDHIQIGCKLYSHDQWAKFTDDEIAQMDAGALEWWNEWRGFVLSLSIGHQQRIAAKKAKPD